MAQIPTQIDMYNSVIYSVTRVLATAQHLLDKAQSHAQDNKITEETMLNLRLIADMHSFKKQIQIVSDNAKGAAARLSGNTPPSFEDNEVTFDDLRARIAKTLDYVKSVNPGDIANSESRSFSIKLGPKEFPFTGYTYGIGFLLPNINFHLAMAYAILRANGVKVGKADYILE